MEKALVAVLLVAHIIVTAGAGSFFQSNFQVTWGADHVQPSADGNSVKMFLDKASGANFAGTKSYVYGGFSSQMQLPAGDSAGVVTALFTTSQGANHDELDYEFLGNITGQPVIMQTNVFANGVGGREERFYLWFDPTQGFHTYEVVWNPKLITFFVDSIPIRQYGNHDSIGVNYPSQPMSVYASIFDGSQWATRGGAVPTDYTKAPFVVNYENFQIQGCQTSGSSVASCSSDTTNWWNQAAYTSLDANQMKQMRWVRQNYMIYGYCTDKSRYATPPAECALNNPA